MSAIIKDYYIENGIPEFLLAGKLEQLDRNEDIAKEFEYWITHHEFMETNPVTEDGYTAKSLAELSPYLKGEGAFMMLIELRETPEVAKKKIASGFKLKD